MLQFYTHIWREKQGKKEGGMDKERVLGSTGTCVTMPNKQVRTASRSPAQVSRTAHR